MRLRFLWYAFVVFGFVASFFFGVSLPKNLADAMTDIAPLEQWWNVHAAHPLLAAFFAGLAVGTVLLPEVWIQIKPHVFPASPRADIAAGEAFKLIFHKSKLADELVRKNLLTRVVMIESHLTEQQKIGGRLRVELADRIHSALASSKITAWGRIDGGNPEREIAFTEWEDAEIDFSPRTLDNSSLWVCAYKRGNDPRGRRIAFVGVRFCKDQLFRQFPLRRLSFRRRNEKTEPTYATWKGQV
jgi:hypothetical protein